MFICSVRCQPGLFLSTNGDVTGGSVTTRETLEIGIVHGFRGCPEPADPFASRRAHEAQKPCRFLGYRVLLEVFHVSHPKPFPVGVEKVYVVELLFTYLVDAPIVTACFVRRIALPSFQYAKGAEEIPKIVVAGVIMILEVLVDLLLLLSRCPGANVPSGLVYPYVFSQLFFGSLLAAISLHSFYHFGQVAWAVIEGPLIGMV